MSNRCDFSQQEDLMCLHITEITGAAMLHVIVSGDAVDGVVQFKPCSMLLPLEHGYSLDNDIYDIPRS